MRELVFAIQRMTAVELSGKYFRIDKKLIARTKKDGLFNYPRIEGIKVLCDSSIGYYLYEQQKMKKFTMEQRPDGKFLVELAPAIEHEATRWILSEGGKIEVLAPDWLRKKIHEAGRKTAEVNC